MRATCNTDRFDINKCKVPESQRKKTETAYNIVARSNPAATADSGGPCQVGWGDTVGAATTRSIKVAVLPPPLSFRPLGNWKKSVNAVQRCYNAFRQKWSIAQGSLMLS